MGVGKRALIAGNWKMNGLRQDGVALATAIAARAPQAVKADILICPPATLLVPCADALADSAVALGAQDCHARPSGAFTGDISARMLKDVGCSHVIVGHSERRAGHGETDAQIRDKAAAALAAGLTAIICVGETEAECDAGQGTDILAGQLRGSVPAEATGTNVVVAYEPVWAIGTGRTPSIADIDAMHRHIRDVLAELLPGGAAIRLLYGGSVKASNAAEILARPDVDGALVGGASLNAEEFWAIVEAAPAFHTH
jgi:triosephosphate isomerase (TIM)